MNIRTHTHKHTHSPEGITLFCVWKQNIPTDYFIDFNPRATLSGSDLPKAKAESTGGQQGCCLDSRLPVLLLAPAFRTSIAQRAPTLHDKLRRRDS